ncbi:LOW QUALITY PROTEIN: zf-RVT domain-containing protein, partial [Cephalotus follicularis]
RSNILHRVHFQEGTLPVTYLGLPLITKKLTKADCSPLVERIVARTNSWVSKALSFAGRLQLVKATLTNMQTYWCSTFLLPMSIIKACEKALRSFLWGHHGRGKVSWREVCKPLDEGGLGIKDLKLWNKSLLLKQIWQVLVDQGLLSWSWRQTLLLRPLARAHLIYRCGNGELFSLWYDPWVHGESVHALYGHRVMLDTGLDRAAKIKDILWEGQWCWPQTSADLIDLQRVLDIPISSGPDCIFWDRVGAPFSTSRAWLGIRTPSNKVPWHSLVWHPQRIPKHAFCLWLALRGAHRTRDKLLTVGVVQSATCAFHCGLPESYDHLFFQCPFSMKV